MKSTLFVLVLVLVLSILAAAPIAAAPLHAAALPDYVSGPCAAGAIYESACDVDHDGDVDIFDIQLTAGRWGQTGTYTSDNDHTHLGQTWTGNNNPLVISGPFQAAPYVPGQPIGAALVLQNTLPNQANSYGYGLRILDGGIGVVIDHALTGIWLQSTDANGLVVNSAGSNGVYVASAGGDGIFVCHTGTASTCNPSLSNNGVEIGRVQGSGLFVDSAGGDGVFVRTAAYNGVNIDSATYTGVYVYTAGTNGVYANTLQVSGQWGFYTPDAIHGSNVLLQSLTLVAQVTGRDDLAPGDIVAVAGVADPVPGSTVHPPLVQLAGGAFTNVVGVVESHLALVQQPGHPQPADGETPGEQPATELRSVNAPAKAGDYVAITIMGTAQVRVQPGEALQPGQRVTVGVDGAARSLGKITVQLARGEGTADIEESAPTLGVVLEAPKDGMVWVLVNPQ